MRIGIVASSGGSVFKELHHILSGRNNGLYKFCVITDRECEIEKYCLEESIECYRIDNKNNKEFSITAKNIFYSFGGVDIVLLFFLRLITKELFMHYPVFNIHPSLLPSFSGFGPIKKALNAGVKFLGSTLHLVDNTIDGGPIVAQAILPIPCGFTEYKLNKLSFLQKVYLGLVAIELVEQKSISFSFENVDFVYDKELYFTNYSNPALTSHDLVEAFNVLQLREGMTFIK